MAVKLQNRSFLKNWIGAPAPCLGLICAEPSSAEIRRALLSVDGVHLKGAEGIVAFEINTWGVEFLAVCRMPPSWALKSEKYANPEGQLSGKRDAQGLAYRSLANFYLVDVYNYEPEAKGNPKSDFHPASFSSWVELGRNEQFGSARGRRVPLKPQNFKLQNARGCPPAPAAQP